MNFFGKAKPEQKGPRQEALPLKHIGSPDSYHLSGLCSRCNTLSSFDILGELPVTFDGYFTATRDGQHIPQYSDRVSSLRCRHCEQCMVVVEEKYVGDKPHHEQKTSGHITFRGIHWWPLPDADVSNDIPSDIASAFSESVKSLAAGCDRASVVMARRTLEAIAVDQGQTSGPLAQRLSNLSASGVLHPSLVEWVKEVRLVGNTGAHFDPIDKVESKDAEDLINFLRELMKYLYELPAELRRRRSGIP